MFSINALNLELGGDSIPFKNKGLVRRVVVI